MPMSEDERKNLYDRLMAEKKGTNYGALGGIASGLSRMVQADSIARGGEFVDAGEPIRQAGTEAKENAQSERDKWRERLKMDTTERQETYQKERDVTGDEFKQKSLDLREKLGMQPKGKAADTKAFDFKPTDRGLVRVNRVTGDSELVQEAAPKVEKPRQVPAGVAVEQGQLKSAEKVLDDFQGSHSQLDKGMIASGLDAISGKFGVPNTEGDIFEKQRRAAAQTIGTILEGGKLTDADFENKYLPLLPGPLDTEESAAAKIANIKEMLKRQQEGAAEGLSEAGYDVAQPQAMEETKTVGGITYKKVPGGWQRVN